MEETLLILCLLFGVSPSLGAIILPMAFNVGGLLFSSLIRDPRYVTTCSRITSPEHQLFRVFIMCFLGISMVTFIFGMLALFGFFTHDVVYLVFSTFFLPLVVIFLSTFYELERGTNAKLPVSMVSK